MPSIIFGPVTGGMSRSTSHGALDIQGFNSTGGLQQVPTLSERRKRCPSLQDKRTNIFTILARKRSVFFSFHFVKCQTSPIIDDERSSRDSRAAYSNIKKE